jgi:hypothetical protein
MGYLIIILGVISNSQPTHGSINYDENTMGNQTWIIFHAPYACGLQVVMLCFAIL